MKVMDTMSSFRSLAGFAACAAGAVVMAAGGYYVHKRGHEEWRTEAFEGTPVHEDPVQIVSSSFLQSSDGHKDMQMDKDNPEGHLEKAEEDKVYIVQLSSEELNVLNLEEKVMELGKLLLEVHRESEIKSKERQAHRVLKEKYIEMKVVRQNEELLKSCLENAEERVKIVVESNAQLELNNSNLKDQFKTLQGSVERLEGELHETQQICEKKLKSCLDEAEERVKIVEESNAQLEHENSNLKGQVKTLQGSVEKFEGELRETQQICEKKLKSCLDEAEERVKIVVESNAQLEHENSNRKDQVKTLQGSVEKFERQLHVTQQICEKKLKSCLDEAEERVKIVVESNAHLEHENSNLKGQVKTLQGSVEKFERQLHETQQICEEILRCQQSELTNLECRYKFQKELLIKELEQEKKFYCTLWTNYENTVSSLAEAEERAKIASESTAQLEYENSVLLEQRKTLQDSVEKLKEQLCETHGKGGKLLKSTLKKENVFLKDRVQTLQGSVEMLEGQLHETQRLYEEILKEREKKDHRNLLSHYEHSKGSLADAQKNAENIQDCSTLENQMLCKAH